MVEMKKYGWLLLLFGCLTLLVFSLFSFVPLVEAETKTLNPVADAHIEDNNPSSNFGGKSYLEVSHSSNIFVGECLALLKFDLSEIPSDVTVQTARLQLYTSIYVTSTHSISVHYSSDNTWTELGINYDDCPSFNTTPTSTTTVASTNTWYEWAVTADVKTALGTADKKLTIVIVSDYHDDSDWVWFESKDQQYSWMEEYIPKLVISYADEDTLPSIGLDSKLLLYIGTIIILVAIFGAIYLGSRKKIQKSAREKAFEGNK